LYGSLGLGGFLTDKELPECLAHWKPYLRRENTSNIGLALRWEAGLAGMEALSVVDQSVRNDIIQEWASAVTNMVSNEVLLDPWCVEQSIISIRVSNKNGGWLNMTDLRHLFRWMSMDVSSLVPHSSDEEKSALSQVAYIGQPVDVADSYAIVRIALGVESMLSFKADKEKTLEEDSLIVKKIAAIANHFGTLLENDN